MSIKGEFSGQRHPVNAQVPLTAYVFESFHRSNCSKHACLTELSELGSDSCSVQPYNPAHSRALVGVASGSLSRAPARIVTIRTTSPRSSARGRRWSRETESVDRFVGNGPRPLKTERFRPDSGLRRRHGRRRGEARDGAETKGDGRGHPEPEQGERRPWFGGGACKRGFFSLFPHPFPVLRAPRAPRARPRVTQSLTMPPPLRLHILLQSFAARGDERGNEREQARGGLARPRLRGEQREA